MQQLASKLNCSLLTACWYALIGGAATSKLRHSGSPRHRGHASARSVELEPPRSPVVVHVAPAPVHAEEDRPGAAGRGDASGSPIGCVRGRYAAPWPFHRPLHLLGRFTQSASHRSTAVAVGRREHSCGCARGRSGRRQRHQAGGGAWVRLGFGVSGGRTWPCDKCQVRQRRRTRRRGTMDFTGPSLAAGWSTENRSNGGCCMTPGGCGGSAPATKSRSCSQMQEASAENMGGEPCVAVTRRWRSNPRLIRR